MWAALCSIHWAGADVSKLDVHQEAGTCAAAHFATHSSVTGTVMLPSLFDPSWCRS